MFGYVVVNDKALTAAEHARYRACYCGLCRALRQKSGLTGTLALNYDMTFLALLLSSLYEPEEQAGEAHCPRHPIGTNPYWSTAYTGYAADIGAALTYYKLLDDWTDERSITRLAAAQLLKMAYRGAKKRLPRQCAAIENQLAALGALEAAGSCDIDALCGCFGNLMGELFIPDERDYWAPVLRQLGCSLGRYLYLLDCCLDRAEDGRKNRFNPLLAAGKKPSGWEAQALALLLGDAAAAFEQLPLVQDASILKNIVYSGLSAALTDELRLPMEKQDES